MFGSPEERREVKLGHSMDVELTVKYGMATAACQNEKFVAFHRIQITQRRSSGGRSEET